MEHKQISQKREIIKAILVALPNLLYKALVSHINQHGFLFNVTDSKWKGKEGKRGGKKSLPPIYRSLAGMASQNIPRKPSGKMTQAAQALSGTVVLARTHSKLESIFPSLDVLGRNDQGQDRKWPRRRVIANIFWIP